MSRFVVPVLIGLLVSMAMDAFSQDSITKVPVFTIDQLQREQDSQLSPHALVYRNAYEIGDWNTAATAAHYLLIEQPGNTFLEDSIATYYFRAGQFQACKTWSERCLRARPEAGQLHLLLAQVYEREGNLAGALSHYEPLAKATRLPYFHYQVAALQLQLKRYGECRQALDALIKAGSEDLIRITSNASTDEVPIVAAAWNLLGVLERELKNEKAAKAAFRKALELAPAFGLARENLHYRAPIPMQEHGGSH